MLKELVNVNLKSFPIIFEKPRPSGGESDDEEKVNVTFIFKQSQKEDQRIYRPVSLTSGPGGVSPGTGQTRR